MANRIAQNPMYIDTPGTTPIVSTGYKIKHIEFVGYAGYSDHAIVTNLNGVTVAELTAASDLQEVRTATIGWVDGIVVPTLTSGALLIYVE